MREGFLGIWKIWNPALKHIDNRLRFFITVGVLDILLMAPIYIIVNKLMAYRGTTIWDPSFALDFQIPFIPWTILFYYTLFFVFYPLPFFTNTSDKREEILILSQAMIVTQYVAHIFFILLPAEVHIRSQAIEELAMNSGWYDGLFEILWMLDTPFNSWPSLHVSQAGLITFFAIRWCHEKPTLQWLFGILWVLMSISILTTKQHFIWDLITSLLLMFGVWYIQIKPVLD